MNVAVITFPGSNCDYDLYKAAQQVGADATFVWHRERGLDGRGLAHLARDTQALGQAMQGPHVLRVAGKVLAVDDLRLRGAAGLEEERSERVTDGLHPAGRFCIRHGILGLDPFPESDKGGLVIAFLEQDLAQHHLPRRLNVLLRGEPFVAVVLARTRYLLPALDTCFATRNNPAVDSSSLASATSSTYPVKTSSSIAATCCQRRA